MKPLPTHLQQLALAQNGVLAVRTLAAAGFTSQHVDRRVAAGLWQRLSAATLLTHGLTPERGALHWAAALHFEDALLTGRAALEIEGLPADPTGRIDIVGLRHGRPAPFAGCFVHASRRGVAAIGTGVPRTTVEVSVLNAMSWSRSDTQATAICVMAIQRGLTQLEALQHVSRSVHGSRTFALARRRLALIPDGAHSTLELDFGRLCARFGLPQPRRQVHRKDTEGRDRYVDAVFAVNGRQLIVEIDGLQHLDSQVKIDDQLRANSFTLQGATVLRVPGLALRTNPAPFMRQIQQALTEMSR